MTSVQQQTSKGNGRVAAIASKKEPKERNPGAMQQTVVAIEVITRAVADRYLKVGAYSKQRPTSERHVAELSAEMRAGRFLRGTSINICEVGDRYILANGRHTLEAIVDCDIPQSLTVVRHRCKNMDEVGSIFSRLDIGKTRTNFVRLRALGICEDFNLNQADTNGLCGGVKIILAGFQHVQTLGVDPAVMRSAEVWATGIKAMERSVNRFFASLEYCDGRKERRMFLRAPVVALGLATFNSQPKRAFEFWANAAADDGLRARSPAHQLHKWLVANRHIKGGALTRCRYVASCWNAYYQGRTLTSVLPADSGKSGITILGTQYKAKKARAR